MTQRKSTSQTSFDIIEHNSVEFLKNSFYKSNENKKCVGK